ncbi:MAG: M50 family metallopeptidase [Tepidisphaerales bacterium]
MFQWLLYGSVPLFTIFGIRVRAHASLVVIAVLIALLGLGEGYSSLQYRVLFITVLFGVVLLHEFGHCFAARAVGGTADDILMTPLGGLAMASPPRRPLPTFITVIGGPLVNVLLMLGAAVVIYAGGNSPSWNPFVFGVPKDGHWTSSFVYASMFFQLNYWLLLFNLLPSYPLDGGQIVQTLLWRPMGYYRSMLTAATVGIFGGAAMMAVGLLMASSLLLMLIGLSCLLTCVNLRQQLLAAGPYAFTEEDADYSAASWRPDEVERMSRAAEREQRRREREALEEAREQEKIDRILDKVARHGMQSLTFFEKRALRKATERQRQRTLQRRR